jgi:hypothetical protein
MLPTSQIQLRRYSIVLFIILMPGKENYSGQFLHTILVFSEIRVLFDLAKYAKKARVNFTQKIT